MQTGLLCIQNSVALLEIMRAAIATFDQQIAEIYRNSSRPRHHGVVSGGRTGAGAASDCGRGKRCAIASTAPPAWPALRASLP